MEKIIWVEFWGDEQCCGEKTHFLEYKSLSDFLQDFELAIWTAIDENLTYVNFFTEPYHISDLTYISDLDDKRKPDTIHAFLLEDWCEQVRLTVKE